MREFHDEKGRKWLVTATEEPSPRHHGRWQLVFRSAEDPSEIHPMPEVRWQNATTADRSIRTMSEFELRRRLAIVLARAGHVSPAG